MTKPKGTVGIWQNGKVRILRPIGRPGTVLYKLFHPLQAWWWRTRYAIGIPGRGSAKTENGYFEERKMKASAELHDQLIQLGFYKYTEPQFLQEAVASQSSYYGYWRDFSEESGEQFDIREVTKRVYHADQEDLVEGGVLKFLRQIEPFLKLQGVEIFKMDEDFNIGGRYAVYINRIEYEMYSEDELAASERGENDVWKLATERTFAMVNGWLKDAGSDERMYLLYGWNDAQAVFLTPEMHQLITENTAIPNHEKPQAVDEESG